MVNSLTKTNGRGQAGPVTQRDRPRVFRPPADVLETADEVLLFLDLPGVRPDAVDVQFERGELVVQGRSAAAEQPADWLVREYEPGDFYRAFLVGQDVDASRISAELRHGVLTVHLPRTDAARPRRITVQS
jgi:HSP20 family protein